MRIRAGEEELGQSLRRNLKDITDRQLNTDDGC